MEDSVCIRLPSLVCDFFEVTATIGEGSGELLNRLPVGPTSLFSRMPATAHSLGLSMFGNMVLMWRIRCPVLPETQTRGTVAKRLGRVPDLHLITCEPLELI
jgi:hypothetical protein